ncbi:MAG: PQQ-dependent sugar dehydrogenase [Gammaproteobacteria bacterium]
MAAWRNLRWWLVLCALGGSLPAHAKTDHFYPTAGDCAGLPRVQLKTPPGFCVGLATSGLKFPRGLAVLADGTVLVAEMAGWVENKGRLLALKPQGGAFAREVLAEGLDRPHGVAIGPDGHVYIGVVGGVKRFALGADGAVPGAKPVLEDVIGGDSGVEPLPGKGRHPLTQLVFGAPGQLFVSVGSASDHCENDKDEPPAPDKPCVEASGDAPFGVIREYRLDAQGKVTGWRMYARGLRNSMALAFHGESGQLWQGENSRDAIQRAMPELKDDEELPHDELNRIEADGDYGWPYCYDDALASPEYPHHDCGATRKPHLLLPAHAAPLGMAFYRGQAFPEALRNSLIVGYHGYRRYGHRLVAFPLNAAHAPEEPARELIGGWGKQAEQPLGAPVGVAVDRDGAIWITEDRNGTLLRLVYLH